LVVGGGAAVGSYVGESERSGGKYQLGESHGCFLGIGKGGGRGAGVILEPAILL